ncbi:MAG: bifunctional demethylmenaquinone methyltransferase/2-methoxy-6-polyprenyl-1,4-benzoquinol methylase UbiE [Chloroflexota bacterium]
MGRHDQDGAAGARLTGTDRAEYVRAMFSRIVPRYDLFNTLSTFGQDRGWRQLAVRQAALQSGGAALDVGTGTGEIAFALAAAAPGARVVGLDFSAAMIEEARRKAQERAAQPEFTVGDALALPYPDHTFDAVTSAFTVRNVGDLRRAFGEMHRVLKPGGRVVCLELTHPHSALVALGFHLYFDRVAPLLGAALSGDRAAYTYLPHSLETFPDAPRLAAIMVAEGFRGVRFRRLNMGTVSCHVGHKGGVEPD